MSKFDQKQDQEPVVLQRVQAAANGLGERLDRYAATLFPEFPTKSAARKAIERGEIGLNGGVGLPYHRVRAGDLIERREVKTRLPAVYEREIVVHYEDELLAIVEKPPGIPVVGNLHRCLLHALPANLAPSAASGALARPRPVHRLDWPTGGLVVVAKTASALAHLSKSFEQRQVRKEYRAILKGRLEGSGTVTSPVDGRSASTEYRALRHCRSLKSDWLTEVRLCPHTGRKHQLRKHMSELGVPVLGDKTYDEQSQTLRGKGLFLWAIGLEFPHPGTGEPLRLLNDPPDKFESLMGREARRWNKYRKEE